MIHTPFRDRALALVIAWLAMPAMSAPVAPGTPPMPNYVVMGAEAGSVPFASVGLAGGPPRLVARDLTALGYVEEEYALAGSANVYDPRGERLITPAAPYVTRMLVVRPKDPRKWSGDIQLSALRNVTEMSEGWALAADYMLEHGDIWIGITVSKDNLEKRLKIFDAKRYRNLTIPDDGFRFDVMMQVAWLMRSPEGLLAKAGYHRADVKVISSGFSMNGMLQIELINSGHHARAQTSQGAPVIDGYISGINNMVLNELPRDAAVIRINSEEEASVSRLSPTFGGRQALAIRMPDTGPPAGLFRLYEIATTIHMGYDELDRARWVSDYQLNGDRLWDGDGRCMPLPVDSRFGKRHFVQAAFANMSDWLHKGTAPPPSAYLNIDQNGGIQRDSDGFALGALRPYWAAIPRSSIETVPIPVPGVGCAGLRSETAFPAKRLKRLYPTRRDYLTKVRAYLAQQVKQRYLRPSDAELDLARASADVP